MAGDLDAGAAAEAAKADSIAFGTPDAHRAAPASLVNLPPP
jgi:NAD(P)H-dependent FMN reductase